MGVSKCSSSSSYTPQKWQCRCLAYWPSVSTPQRLHWYFGSSMAWSLVHARRITRLQAKVQCLGVTVDNLP